MFWHGVRLVLQYKISTMNILDQILPIGRTINAASYWIKKLIGNINWRIDNNELIQLQYFYNYEVK
jgi:hypothetical protein